MDSKNFKLANRMQYLKASEIRELLKLTQNPEVISFAGGLPAAELFPVPELVSFISRIMTLLPGDVIATGTPKGIGPMQPGDTVRVEVEGIGSLENPVAGTPAAT